jgi:hypothetical protein
MPKRDPSMLELDYFYKITKCYIVKNQSATSGLIGDGQLGFIRDTVSSAGAMWAMSIAYKHIDEDKGKAKHHFFLINGSSTRKIL